MVITDRFNHLLDEKGRLSIPSQVRSAMDPATDGNCFYILHEGRYLQLIPEKYFAQLVDAAKAGLMVDYEESRLRRLMFGGIAKLEWDKQGRAVVPERYLKAQGKDDPFGEAILEREVTLVGVGDRMELWNRTDFIAHYRELMADRADIRRSGMAKLGQVPVTAPVPTQK